MSSRRLLTLPVCLAAFAAVPTVADAASTPKYPTISKITPMRATIGETMTITGSNFIRGQRKNTVVFKRDGKPALFVKADAATPTRLTLILPEKLRTFLGKRQDTLLPTRFRIRISARRFGKGYTKLASSPVITPAAADAGVTPDTTSGGTPTTSTTAVVLSGAAAAGSAATSGGTTTTGGDTGSGGGTGTGGTPAPDLDCDDDGILDADDSDDDGDLLADTTEVAINTNRCAKDTDGDGMEDGWEWKSAYDLNQASCPAAKYPTPCAGAAPYPGKRPYPNPLDSTDLGYDYDGDTLPAWAEHQASLRHGRSVGELWYSEGRQASLNTSSHVSCRGAAVPAPLDGIPAYTLDRDGSGCLTDEERDEDGDHLTNAQELNGQLSSPNFWLKKYAEPLYPLNLTGTDWLDQDTDGDGVDDGRSDQDNDDFWNVEEVYRGLASVTKEDVDGPRSGLWVNPFNPCLPSPKSRTCMRTLPLEGDIVRPFVKEDATRAQWPKPRWPLYGGFYYDGPNGGTGTTPEVWNAPISQTLPPPHPLNPRPGS